MPVIEIIVTRMIISIIVLPQSSRRREFYNRAKTKTEIVWAAISYFWSHYFILLTVTSSKEIIWILVVGIFPRKNEMYLTRKFQKINLSNIYKVNFLSKFLRMKFRESSFFANLREKETSRIGRRTIFPLKDSQRLIDHWEFHKRNKAPLLFSPARYLSSRPNAAPGAIRCIILKQRSASIITEE